VVLVNEHPPGGSVLPGMKIKFVYMRIFYIFATTNKQPTQMTTTLNLLTPKGKRVVTKAPTNSIAVANITEGDGSPCPSEYVEEELYHLRLMLGRMRLDTNVVSIQVTDHCSMNYILLKEDTLDNRIVAKNLANEFCRSAEFLYTI
jgi:hypothetical protein